MKIQTNILDILDRLSDLEQLAANLYAHYGKLFNENRDALDLFGQMQMEEESHRDLVLLQKHLLSRVLSSADFLVVDMENVDSVANAILAQISDSQVSLSKALEFAIWMETSGMESAYRFAATKYCEPLERLSKKLSADDHAHVLKLKKLKSAL